MMQNKSMWKPEYESQNSLNWIKEGIEELASIKLESTIAKQIDRGMKDFHYLPTHQNAHLWYP